MLEGLERAQGLDVDGEERVAERHGRLLARGAAGAADGLAEGPRLERGAEELDRRGPAKALVAAETFSSDEWVIALGLALQMSMHLPQFHPEASRILNTEFENVKDVGFIIGETSRCRLSLPIQ